MAVRLYFDLVSFEALIAETSIINIESFKVYEGATKDGNFVNVCMVTYNPQSDFITVPVYVAMVTTPVTIATVDGYHNEFDWFKLSYLAGYQALVTIQAEVIPITDVAFAYTLATYPIQARSVVLKIASVTLGTTLTLNPMGDFGNGIITGDNIISAVINYTSGFLMGTLATTPSGAFTVDYNHFTEYHQESELSDPVLSENIATILDQVRVAIHDTSETNPAFTDDELIRKVKESIKRFTGESFYILQEYQMSVIILLVRISCCYDLAYNSARYYHLELPDQLKLFRGEITEHYLKLAQALEKQYQQLNEDIGEGPGTTFDVIDCTKKTYFKSPRFRSQEYTDDDSIEGAFTTIENSRVDPR